VNEDKFSEEEPTTDTTMLTVLDQLGESLIVSSAGLARMRRASKDPEAFDRELRVIDDAISRSIRLTRTLRGRLLAIDIGQLVGSRSTKP
jgi:hypothetical protein